MNDLASTLNEIREVISILLKELVGLQLTLKEKDKELEMYQNSGSFEDTQYISLETEFQSSVMETETMDDEIAVLELVARNFVVQLLFGIYLLINILSFEIEYRIYL